MEIRIFTSTSKEDLCVEFNQFVALNLDVYDFNVPQYSTTTSYDANRHQPGSNVIYSVMISFSPLH